MRITAFARATLGEGRVLPAPDRRPVFESCPAQVKPSRNPDIEIGNRARIDGVGLAA